ncbi:MAG: hypothetical protein KY445_14440 [Armatimonadetes bacterium]|nr:hypothetical protein [Armatimonadota bacterium]
MVKSPEKNRVVLRGFAVLCWVLSLFLLGIFTGVLIPIEEQRGREWGVPLILFFAAGGFFLWFVNPLPTLEIDMRGISIGKKLIPWREISQCEIHTRTDELGETISVTLHLKNRFGVTLGIVTPTASENERERLRNLIRAYLGADADTKAAPAEA